MSVADEVLRKYQHAGRIVAEVREEIRKTVRPKMPIIEVCEKVEKLIREKGGKPAFPCNVSINEVAAHHTSPPGDKQTIPENAVVKVDVGAHVDGYIGDSAVTVCFNPEHDAMVHAAEEALRTAVEAIRPGIFTSKLGALIENTIRSHGFKPISNLVGHKVDRYLLHAGKSVPNVAHLSLSKVNIGEVYAIEPFVTLADAAGKVESGKEATIFRFLKRRTLKNSNAKQLLGYIEENFRTLPFTERWLKGALPQTHYEIAFQELLSSKSLMPYPIFIEASGKPVTQAEHTVVIVEEGCIVLT